MSNTKQIQMTVKDILRIIMQLFIIPVLYTFELILRPKIEKPKKLELLRGTLIIANHQSRLDPFLVSSHLGLLNLLKALPIRYPVASKYMRMPVLGTIVRSLGGYDIGETPFERAKKLLFTLELIRKGYTVVLFPEGKMVRQGESIIEFKKGVDMLLKENIPLLLVRLSGMNSWSWFDIKRKNQVESKYSNLLVDLPVEKKVNYLQNFFTTA